MRIGCAPAFRRWTTTKGESAAASGEIVGADPILDVVHDIEGMKEEEARAAVKMLSDATEETFFKLGGVLAVIYANSWYKPYGSFRDFIENEYGIGYSRAMYWINIYNRLVEASIKWEQVKSIGWSKLKEIARVLTTDNVEEWVKIASEQTVKLIVTVKSYEGKNVPEQITDESSKTVTTKTFKVHAGQKETIESALEKAKEAANTTVDTVALEVICLDYLGGQTLAQRLQAAGLEKALSALETAFPGTDFAVSLPEAAE